MTNTIVVPAAGNDPLFTRVRFECDAIFYPHGFPARVRSNSAVALEAAEASWGTHRYRHGHRPLEIRLVLSKSDNPPCVAPPNLRHYGHLASIIADRENFASLDLCAGFAFVWATEATARSQKYFGQRFLAAMIDTLLKNPCGGS